MNFIINGVPWVVLIDNPNSDALRRSDGSLAVGVTDAGTNTVTLSNLLSGEFLRKVLIHEICHCVCFSYGIHIPIDQEEFVCDFVASHGDEVFDVVAMLSNVVRKAV